MKPDDVLAEFSDLLDSYDVKDEDVRGELRGVVNAMLDESHWRQLEEGSLIDLLYRGISLYGQTNWDLLAQIIAPVYLHATDQVVAETRRELQGTITKRMEAGEVSANALLPFLSLDVDLTVVSTAALDSAMVPAAPEDDPIAWPRRLISDLEGGMGSNKGAILGGLITLGDQRVIELLSEVKWLMSDGEVGVAIKCVSGLPTIAAFEFWLEWVEELIGAGLENTALFGQVSSGIPLLIKSMRVDTFAEITRNFGYLHWDGEDAQSLVVHKQHSKPEVGERYAERLFAIEAAESPPKLASEVIRQLGLEPKAPFEERYSMQ